MATARENWLYATISRIVIKVRFKSKDLTPSGYDPWRLSELAQIELLGFDSEDTALRNRVAAASARGVVSASSPYLASLLVTSTVSKSFEKSARLNARYSPERVWVIKYSRSF